MTESRRLMLRPIPWLEDSSLIGARCEKILADAADDRANHVFVAGCCVVFGSSFARRLRGLFFRFILYYISLTSDTFLMIGVDYDRSF